jgi:MSHA biogenesis protein MshP
MRAARRFVSRRPRSAAAAPRGFAFVTAVFLLVMLAAMAAFVVTLVANASASSALALQSARAHHAAGAALEWAAYRLRDPDGVLAPGATALPDCFASPRTLALPGEMAAFNVELTCQRFPAAGTVPGYHEEDARRSVYFVVTATAAFGTAGSAEYVERRLEARIEKCKDPAAPAPAHAC